MSNETYTPTGSQVGFIHRRVDAEEDVRWIRRALVDRQTEVSNSHISFDVNEDVGGLEVSMDNAAKVRSMISNPLSAVSRGGGTHLREVKWSMADRI
jgi:hypothetical protein